MQLLINPFVNAHGHDLLQIAGARAKGQAIERVHGALLFVQAGIAGLILLLGEQMRNRAGEAQGEKKQRRLDDAGSHADSRKGQGSPHYEPRRQKKLLASAIPETLK